MVDIMPILRASVQAYKLCHATSDNDFKPRTKRRDICSFYQQAKQIVGDIVQLRDFLLSHRKQYVNIDHWLDGTCLMTDYERNRIDAQSQTLIKTCQHVMGNLKKAVALEKTSKNVRMHREAVIEIITDFLKAVTNIYSEQKAIRVQRSIENRKLLRLENLVTYTESLANEKKEREKESTGSPINRRQTMAIFQASDTREKTESVGQSSAGKRPNRTLRRRKHDAVRSLTTVINPRLSDDDEAARKSIKTIQKSMHKKIGREKLAALEADVEQSKEDWHRINEDLQPEEKIQLEIESRNLREELTAKVDELKMVEGKVVEIARLQDIFSEKILQQEADIYRINDAAIHTTENVKCANDSIRQALKRKATMRIYVIFALLVLSFTLLFLDWYNA